MSSTLSRRSVLKGIIAGTVTMGIPMRFSDFALNTNEKESGTDVLKGNINHSVARWCFNDIDLDTLCRSSKLGIKGIDLVGPKEWPILKSIWFRLAYVQWG
jgi:hydroxypyruvate isomerase